MKAYMERKKALEEKIAKGENIAKEVEAFNNEYEEFK